MTPNNNNNKKSVYKKLNYFFLLFIYKLIKIAHFFLLHNIPSLCFLQEKDNTITMINEALVKYLRYKWPTFMLVRSTQQGFKKEKNSILLHWIHEAGSDKLISFKGRVIKTKRKTFFYNWLYILLISKLFSSNDLCHQNELLPVWKTSQRLTHHAESVKSGLMWFFF